MSLNLGQQIRDAQLDMFEVRDADFLEHCRSVAIQIAKRQGEVSINDVRQHLQVPFGVNPSVLGAVFRTKQFRKIGHCEAFFCTHTENSSACRKLS